MNVLQFLTCAVVMAVAVVAVADLLISLPVMVAVSRRLPGCDRRLFGNIRVAHLVTAAIILFDFAVACAVAAW